MSAVKLFVECGANVGPQKTRAELNEFLPVLAELSQQLYGLRESDFKLLFKELPVECTLPRLIIHRKCDSKEFLSAVADTLRSACPLHMTVGMDLLCEVVDKFTRIILESPLSMKHREAIEILEGLLMKMNETGFDSQCLTPLHTDLLSLYMVVGEVQCALPIAHQTFRTAHNPLKNSASILAFFYYSGIVLTWNKEYEAAEKCFELVAFSPALAVPSWIVICAYRKLILVSLIVHGRVPPATALRFRSFTEMRGFPEEAHMQVYETLAMNYHELRLNGFRSARSNFEKYLKVDGNFGLVKVAEAHMMRHLVVKMQSLYTVCTLAQVFKLAGMDKPSAVDLDKIRSAVDSLHASGMDVSFKDAERTIIQYGGASKQYSFDTPESVTSLQTLVHHVLEESKVLEDKRESTMLNKDAGMIGIPSDQMLGDDFGRKKYYMMDDDDDDD